MIWQTDWTFGLIGGLMIGCAAAIFLIAGGRIMGVSGILGALIDGTGRQTAAERIAFLAGLIGVPALYVAFTSPVPGNITPSLGLLVLAGLLVGIGTRIGNGCTSGHGVCGMSRFSRRSIIATLIYIGAGALTVLVLRHGLGVI